MDRPVFEKAFASAWNTSEEINKNGGINQNLQGIGTKNPPRNKSKNGNNGQGKVEIVKRVALIVNIIGAVISSGILINRASICIQK